MCMVITHECPPLLCTPVVSPLSLRCLLEGNRIWDGKFGTPKVCQIMAWYSKIRSHFSRCHCSACGMHITIVPNNKRPEASRK